MTMEDRIYKKTIGVIIVAVIFAVAVYGSYLPMRKAQLFIATLQDLDAHPAAAVIELQQRIAPPLDYPSPIGQEELVRNVGNSVLGFVQGSHDPRAIDAMLTFLGGYFDPIVARGTGMSFGQDLYLLGAMNEIAFENTGEPSHIEDARKYFEEGMALGPNRPQSLYGLFDVDRAMGDVTSTAEIARTILTNWPNDERVQQSFADFLSRVKSAQASSTAAKAAK